MSKGFDFYDWGPGEIRLRDQLGPGRASRSSGSPRQSPPCDEQRSTFRGRPPLHHLHRHLGLDLDRHPRPARHCPAAMVRRLSLHHCGDGHGARCEDGAAKACALAGGCFPALLLGFAQFCINFNAVYLAERHITSGVVATIFALLLIPSTLMAWAFLGHRPSGRFVWSS